MEKRQPLQQMFLEKLDICMQKTEIDPCLSCCMNINSKWIKYLYTRPKTLKLVQERVGNTPELTGIGNNCLNRTSMAQELRERIEKWDYMKQKVFSTTKEMVTRLKRQLTEWEKNFSRYTSDKGLIT
jgi:hypothetical protein